MYRKGSLKWLMVMGIALGGGPAFADITTDDPSLPPTDGVYLHPGNVHVLFSGPTLDLILERPEHKAILVELRDRLPQPGPAGEREVFFSTLEGGAQICPPGGGVCGGPSIPFVLNGPVETHVFGKDPTDTTGSWDTEMVSMSLSGNVGGNPVMIRESPTQASTGHTIVTDIGGGLFNIDSFFDVWTEVSLDGGTTWIPSASSTRMVLVPEPLSIVLVGIGIAGLLGLRRRG